MGRFKKLKSAWAPCWTLFIKQIYVSLISYITFPYYKKKENGVLLYFENNYYKKKDDLIFDGNTGKYYDILLSFDIQSILLNANVLDLGCGQASFFFWLKDKNIKYKSYLGLDFAIKPSLSTEGCIIKRDNILNYANYLSGEIDVLLLCNVLCYLSDSDFQTILEESPVGCVVLVIDPTPGFFWDAHFSGIRPIYRKMSLVTTVLQQYGFCILERSQDYLMSIMKQWYLFPLSYCICARRGGILDSIPKSVSG